MRKKTSIVLVVGFALTATIMLVPQVKAATVIIHDDPNVGEHVIKPKDECLEDVNAIDGIKAGNWDEPWGGSVGNIWLRKCGSVTVTSTCACNVIHIQYHSSDDNDGVTDIYVDDMNTPIVRIDTYMRGTWYVEIKGLPWGTHTVKVHASSNSNMTGAIPSPHRPTPSLGDNDVWYFCFAESGWPMFHYDLNRTGYSTSTGPNTNNVLWGYNICNWDGCSVDSSPAVADGKVYVGSDDDNVYCLDAYTGELIWTYTTGDDVDSSPAVAYGNVYVGSNDNWVYCLPADDPNGNGVIEPGEVLWKFHTGNNVSSPAVVDGRVYVGSMVNNMYCLDALTGACLWAENLYSGVLSPPVVVEGKVYVGTEYDIWCLNASTGAKVWECGMSEVEGSPAFANDKIYVRDGYTLYCLPKNDPDNNGVIDDSEVIWYYTMSTAGRMAPSSPAVAYGKVYVGGAGWPGKIYCLPQNDPNDNGVIDDSEVIWTFTTISGSVYSSPAVADGKVYVGSDDNTIYCLPVNDPNDNGVIDDSEVIWSHTASGSIRSSPAVAYGNVYVGKKGTWGPEVYSFGPTYTLIITKTTGGTTDPSSGTHTYAYGLSVDVSATPDECYEFDHWELDGNDVGSDNPYSVYMDSDHTLHTVFTQIEYDLTITATSGGTTDPAPEIYTYGCSSSVEVTAIPEECYEFDHWELDGNDVGLDNPYLVVMDSNHTLHAAFFRAKACFPSPADGAKDVATTDVVLSWTPGERVADVNGHDVYFGTDYNDVNDANSSWPVASGPNDPNVYKGRQDANSYDPCGLELAKTYYWRVDEINEPNVWKGAIWRFMVNHIVLDDFEDYNDVAKPLWDTWLDGWWNDTGSELDLGIDPCDPVHAGEQSMIYDYNNSYDQGAGYYSEIEAATSDLGVDSDWYGLGAKALTLYFYGDPNNEANDTEQIYVGLEDGLSNYGEVRYGDYGEDMNDIKSAEWQEWKIDLQDFNDAGVDVNDVNKVYIGFGDRGNQTVSGGVGVVYFDDIRLYARYGPSDINWDGVVDFEDLEMMCDEWLFQSGQLDADLYKDEDNRVNFKDFAVLANSWLEGQP